MKVNTLDKVTGFVFTLPALILFLLFIIYPIVNGFIMAFFSWNGFNPERTYVGITNFEYVMRDRTFWLGMRNIAILAASAFAFMNTIALMLATLASTKIPGSKVYRIVFYLPVMLSGIVVGFVWRWLFNGNYGLINLPGGSSMTGGAGVAVVSRGKSAEQKQNAYTFLQWFLCSEEGARVQKEKNDFYTHVKKAYEDPEYKSFTHRLFGDTDVGPVWFDEMLKDISMRPTTPCDRFLYDARIQTAGLLVDESFSSAAAQWDKFKDLYNNMEPDILIK